MKISLLISLLLLSTSNLFASEALDSSSMKEIEAKVLAQGKKYGVKNVLAVFDIDNTLLAMPQNFGSDQWFGWQSKNCMGKSPLPKFCTTANFGELLDIQGQIFSMSNMIPTEQATTSVIKNLQAKGFKVIALTSRGYAFRNSTERALKNNGMWFVDSAIGPKHGYAGNFKPYSLKNPKRNGLTKSDIKKMGQKRPRSTSYMNGVYMTAGLDKGIMLKTLLHKTKSKFKAIIFADDHKKHTVRMQAILGADSKIDLSTYRYGKIDPEVKAFHAGDKEASIQAWNKLKEVTKVIFK